jgi:RNA recognition motif-containing protein
MRIYVGNLSSKTTENDLRKAFEAFGQVRFVNIIRDSTTDESQGYGFVTMPLAKEAQAAIENLRGKDLNGQEISVQRARIQTQLQVRRPRRGRPESRGHRRPSKRSGFGSRGRGRRR